YQVLRVSPKNSRDIGIIENEVQNLALDVWKETRKSKGAAIDIMISGSDLSKFTDVLGTENIPFFVMISDVQGAMDNQKSLHAEYTTTRALNHTTYHTIEEIYGILNALEDDYPEMVKVFDAGVTHEGRPIRVMK
ncbi:hypothetical protein SK128_008312, partial [Halocaridina rubra]